MEVFQRMEDELGQAFPKVFRSITADNGAENSMLAEIESVTGTPVYRQQTQSLQASSFLRRYLL